MSSSDKKSFLLRVDPEIMGELQRWADDDLRSLNGQIEYLLRQALREAGRSPKPRPPNPDESPENDKG